jgi:hypothetical protein
MSWRQKMTRKILADKSLKCKRDDAKKFPKNVMPQKKFPKNPILFRQQSQPSLLVDRKSGTNKYSPNLLLNELSSCLFLQNLTVLSELVESSSLSNHCSYWSQDQIIFSGDQYTEFCIDATFENEQNSFIQ